MDNNTYYSNCLFEAVKHKLKHPMKYKIKFISPRKNNSWMPHWMWYDKDYIYDFYTDTWTENNCIFWWKGRIRRQKIKELNNGR